MKINKEKKIIALIIVFTIILQTMLPIAMAVEDLNNTEKEDIAEEIEQSEDNSEGENEEQEINVQTNEKIEEIVGNSYGDFEYTIDDEKVTITGGKL